MGLGQVAATATAESIVKKTVEKVGFNIKSLPAGIYAVTVKKVGYADRVITVAIAEGDSTQVNVTLSKN
ncbi:MAG: carboxypeptidase regulatory-like domain-containing protein [Bacteroidales bacterium]|nr:carboxypeptidase regulatory-like domain-containing protein [Bacteroidales bacterium]